MALLSPTGGDREVKRLRLLEGQESGELLGLEPRESLLSLEPRESWARR
jgi:hypothetical protein